MLASCHRVVLSMLELITRAAPNAMLHYSVAALDMDALCTTKHWLHYQYRDREFPKVQHGDVALE